ncbi:uncharacterized protein ARMOST_10849 [Armillaria ostoyae]|uniref:Uncharacterized protein n=1 Tax=Armillaria ostoyae TaxID=47428 RepID=A0A284RFH0_ARMOS|nr:uncharacterized protein ARMOST_10849 [Armillaria ostoyae]
MKFLAALEAARNLAIVSPATQEDITHATIYQHRIIAAYIAGGYSRAKICGVLRHPADQDDKMPAWAKRLSDKVDGLRERVEQLAASVHNSSSSG